MQHDRFWLFFDKCLGTSLSKKLDVFYRDSIESQNIEFRVLNLIDKFAEGADDRSWLTVINEHPDWIVITSDKSKDPKTEKLRNICKEIKVTSVVINPSIDTTFKRIEALSAIWRFLRWVPYLPKGTEVKLRTRHLKSSQAIVYELNIQNTRIDLWCHKNGINIPEILK